MARIYTARMDYTGRDRLDITRGNAEFSKYGSIFAPSQQTLNAWLKARKSTRGQKEAWEAYRKAFRLEMIQSFRKNKEVWEAIIELEEVTLVCFCEDANRCHRTIVASEMLPKMGAIYAGER